MHVCPLSGTAKSIEEGEKEEERRILSVEERLARNVYCNYKLLSLLSGKYIEMYIIIFYELRNHNK